MTEPAAVVICCRDRAALLEQALVAVNAALRPGDELVVVDSASRDTSVETTARAAGARYVRVDAPGLSRARNAGWRATDRPVVLFTDDDCLPAPGWVAAGAEALAVPGVGVVWGPVAAEESGGGLVLSTLDDSPAEVTLADDLASVAHGANLGFRRQALTDIAGADELLGTGAVFGAGEDKDLLWRAMRAGWRAQFAPAMTVGHVQWRGDLAALRVMYRYGLGAGAVAVKRHRIDGTRGLVWSEVLRHGIRHGRRSLLRRRYGDAAAAAVRTAGVVAGAWRASRLELDPAGHLRPR